MSYEIVKSINEKEKSVVCASNNIRPLHYSKCNFKEGTTLEDFRTSVMRGVLFGDLHISNVNHKYNLIAAKIKATDEYKDLHEKLWNFDDTYTDEYVSEHYEENINKLNKLILKTFNERITKEKYVIWDGGCCYIHRINKWTYSYGGESKAKVYSIKEVAMNCLKALPDFWKVKKLA